MSNTGKCARCGRVLGADAPEGVCPHCLLALNLEPKTAMPGDPTDPPGGGLSQPRPAPEEMAKLFPQLEIIGLLGQGGMGVVYKARQARLNRLVALKILSPEREKDPQFAERFEREAQALARLNHPNIVTVYDFGESGGHYYLVMEFVDGTNLRELLRAGHLAPEQALAIVPRICEALQFAHEQGIIHRDIKPENILLDKQGRVKVADFGLVKLKGPDAPPGAAPPPATQAPPAALTKTGRVLGTPHYMAPEQVERPQAVDHRADIYSLGVVFYEMLTGELPLGKFQPPSQKVQVDVRLDTVVLRALEKEPERRYQHANEVQTVLQTIASTSAPPPQRPATQPGRKAPTKKALWYGLVAAGFCLAAAGASLIFWPGRALPPGNAPQLTREAWLLTMSGRFHEADAKLSQAIKADPKDAEVWNGVGWLRMNTGSAAEAEKAFQKAVSLAPNHLAALRGLGQLCMVKKQYREAEACLLKAGPGTPIIQLDLASLYLLQGDYPEAEKWAQKALDSGEANDIARPLLQAAKEKRLPDALLSMPHR
jgi:serine/threonine protein kinase